MLQHGLEITCSFDWWGGAGIVMAASVGFDLLDVAEELEKGTRELPQGV